MPGAGQPIDSVFDEPVITAQFARVTQLANNYAAVLQQVQTINTTLGNSNTVPTIQRAIPQLATANQQLARAQNQLNQAYSQSNLTLQSYRVQTQQVNASARQQARETLGQVGAYEKLNAQYVAARLNAQNLAAEFGRDSIVAKEAAASAAVLGAELKAIDSTVGISTRNVGNYSSAFSKAFGAIRTAANILPAIGISGIFLLLGEGIAALVEKFSDIPPAFKPVVESIRNYNNVVMDANKNSGSEISNVQILAKVIADETIPRKDRLTAIKQLQDEYPQILGNYSEEAFLSGQLTGEIKKLTEALFAKALAEAEAQKAASLTIENLDRQRRENFLLNEIDKTQNNIAASAKKAGISTQAFLLTNGAVEYIQHLKDLGNLLSDNAKRQAFNTEEIQKYQAAAEKAFPELQEFIKTGDLSKQSDNFKQFFLQLLKAQQEGEQILLQDEIKFRQAIADSEGFSYQQRLDQARKASELRIQLISENRDAELRQNQQSENEALKTYQKQEDKVNGNTKISADERGKILSDAASARNVAEAAFAQERQNIITKADIAIRDETISTSVELGTLHKKYLDLDKSQTIKNYADLDKIRDEFGKAGLEHDTELRKGALASDLDMESKSFENLTAIRSVNFEKNKQALAKQLQDNVITYTQYQAQLKKLTIDNQRQGLEDTLNDLEAQARAYEKNGTVGSTAYQKIQAAIAKTRDELLLLPKDTELAIGKVKDIFEKVGGYINQAFDIIGSAVENSVTRQKNALQSVEDQQETNYEADVTRINDSTLNEQDKAAKLIQLDAERTAQKETNARKEREISRKQAAFEKAATIANIVTTTALAVVRALAALPGPPATIPAAILTGALGAAQLAVAIAAPLPAFEHGTDYSPEGYARVSESGRELRIEPDGCMSMTPENESVTYLKRGTKIISNDEVDKFMLGRMMRNTAARIEKAPAAISSDRWQEKYLKKIANKPVSRGTSGMTMQEAAWYAKNVKN